MDATGLAFLHKGIKWLNTRAEIFHGSRLGF